VISQGPVTIGVPVRIGARTSPLARAQAELVADALRSRGAAVDLVGITTRGDTDRRSFTEIAADAGAGVGTGLFAAAVRQALLAGEIDVAVHSAKDLPTADAEGITLAAVPAREDRRDVLIGSTLADLPDGALVGTGSPRRAVQLEAWAAAQGRTIEIVPARGNVDTRLGLVRDGRLAAVVLAAAGLRRLGRLGPELGPYEILPTDVMLPAAAQACLAVETRSGVDPGLGAMLAELDDPAAHTELIAERAFLAAIEAGCLAPVGVSAELAIGGAGGVSSSGSDSAPDQVSTPGTGRSDLTMTAVIGRTLLGSPRLTRLTVGGTGREAADTGRELARRLLALVDADNN